MRKTLRLILMLLAASVGAQSAYMGAGESGPGLEARVRLGDAGELLGGAATVGYSIAGILDFGLGTDLLLYEHGGREATDTSVLVHYGAAVARQGAAFPLSIRLNGSYGVTFVRSRYYEDRNEMRQGRGFSVGGEVLRDFAIVPGLAFRVGFVGDYSSYLYVTDSEETPEDAFPYPIHERETDFRYGATTGLVLKSRNGTAVAVTCTATLDRHGEVSIEPALAVASARARSRR